MAREEYTDRDSDDSDREVRELKKELLAVKEKSKAIEDKLDRESKRTRRVRTGNSGGIFQEERNQDQYAELEREFVRSRQSRTLRKVKRSKEHHSSTSWGASRNHACWSPRQGGRNSISKIEEKEESLEGKDMIGVGDFMGLYPKNFESKLRRILKRIKSNSISDPVTKGKIINTTGGRWLHFCCDTGSSVNLMPAKMAAAGGLIWRTSPPTSQ